MDCRWHQIDVAFPDWAGVEQRAVTHLAPLLTTAEAEGLITSWFFIRKAPCWRVRYLPAGDTTQTKACIKRHLDDLKRHRHITQVSELVYEPESHAFGGVQGMVSAHRLFHLDSRHVLDYLADPEHVGSGGHRRELSILLCTGLLRAAGLDWYEQGDVWARVAEHRDTPTPLPADELHTLKIALRRLMSVDIAGLLDEGSSLGFAAGWAEAYAVTGRELADLTAHGRMHRGLRAVLAHHIVFAWNRLGLPHATQAVLATTAKTVVFGPDPARSPATEHRDERWGE